MNRAVIISGPLAQDHEFIYPFYRLLEEGFSVDVCIIGGKPVLGILGTTLPPNKNHPVKDIHDIKTDDYDLLVLPGGVKAMEKIAVNIPGPKARRKIKLQISISTPLRKSKSRLKENLRGPTGLIFLAARKASGKATNEAINVPINAMNTVSTHPMITVPWNQILLVQISRSRY